MQYALREIHSAGITTIRNVLLVKCEVGLHPLSPFPSIEVHLFLLEILILEMIFYFIFVMCLTSF